AFRVTTNRHPHRPEIGGAMLFPRFRLRYLGTNVQSEQCRKSAEPEHPSPSDVWIGEDDARGDGSEQIADRIAALQNARQDAAPFPRHLLHRERSADAPLPTHPDAK